MNIAPILACGPNEGLAFVVYTVYGGMGAGALSLGSGVAGVVCMCVGRKKAGNWLFATTCVLALIWGGVCIWLGPQ